MRNRRRTLALLVLASSSASVVAARTASAADGGGERIDIAWTAPAECPSSSELRERVVTRVPADATVRARGRAERRAGRYRLSLEIESAFSKGERAIDASTCDALASSAAVVIAMSVAPPADRASEREEETAAPAPAPAPAAAPVAAPSPLPPQPERPREPPAGRGDAAPRVLLRAELAGDAGLLPSAAVGGGLAIGVVLLRDLSLEANAQLFATQDGTVDGAPARGASFALLTGGARACWALTRGIEIAPCAGIEVARIGASGFGAARVSDAETVTWGPEALLAGRIPVAGPLSVRAGLGAFVPISRQSFVINAAGTVHQPQVVALRTFLGPEVRF